jgi:ABC-type multidrug transport system ATPase subunit
MSAFRHFQTLNLKCLWISKRNPLSFLLVTLLPTVMVIIISLNAPKKSSSAAKENILDGSLCTRAYCPTLYYTPKGLSAENATRLDNLMNAVKGIAHLGVKDVVKVASSKDMFQKYNSYYQDAMVSTSTTQDIFALFQYDEASGLMQYSFPRMEVDGLVMSNRISAVFASVSAGLGLGSDGTSPAQRFQLRLQPETIRSEISIVDVTLFWLSLVAACFPLFLLVAYRTNSERSQGVSSLMSQWGVSDTVYIFTHIFHYTLFPLLCSTLFVITATILKAATPERNIAASVPLTSYTPQLEFLSPMQLFMIFFFISFLAMLRGLFAGLALNNYFARVSFLLLFVVEFVLGDNLETLLGMKKEVTPVMFILFPFMNVAKMLLTLKRNSDDAMPKSSKDITMNALIVYGVVSVCLIICQSLMLKVLRSNLDSSSPLASLRTLLHCGRSSRLTNTNDENESELLLSHISKAYGKRQVVTDANLTATTGKVYSLLGKNGAGKSTLMKMIAGMVHPSAGSIKLFGHDLLTNRGLRNKCISYCAQENQYWHDLTLAQHVRLFSSLVGKSVDVDSELERVGLETSGNTLANDLSGGQKRRLNLVLCGIKDSKLILLDEPTSGVDYVTQIRIWEYIESLKHNAIVILATHYMEEAHLLSDHLVIMQEGKIECEGTTKTLQADYGEMYQLKMLVKESTASQLQQLLKNSLPFLSATHVAQGSFKLSFEPQHIKAVSMFLKQAVNLCEFSFQLTNNTVDRIFNLVYKDSNDALEGDASMDKTQTPTPDPLISEPHKVLELNRVDTQSALFFNQVRANYSKNLNLMARNFNTVSSYLLLLIALLVIPQLLLKPPGKSEQPTEFRLFNRSRDYLDNVVAAFDFDEQVKNDAAALQKAGIDVNQKLETGNLVAELKRVSERMAKDRKNNVFCGYKLSAFSVDRLDSTIVHEFGNRPEACIEWIMAAYLKSYQNPTKSMFQPVFASLDTSHFYTLKFTLTSIATIMKYVFSIVVVLLAGQFVLHEKKRGMDLALRFQGMLPSAYWTGTLLYHLFLISVVTLVLTVYVTLTTLSQYANTASFLVGFFCFGIFLSGMSNLYTTFLRTEANFTGYCTVLLLILDQYLNTDEVPWVYMSPFGLYARMALSTLLGRQSVAHTWVPIILFVVYGLLFVALTTIIEEQRKGFQLTFSRLFSSRSKSKEDTEEYAMEQLDSSTTQEMRDIRQGKKSLSDHAIVANNVSKRFGEKSALQNVYLALGKNECFGLLGPNGAGKSTLINMILGILHPTSGTISLNDKGSHYTVGYCPQFGFFWPEFTVYEHLTMAAIIRGAKSGEEKAWALNVAQQVGLASESALKTKPYDLSGGMRRRLCLGMALIGEPGLLILDEPTSGVDPLNRENIWRIVENYRQHKQQAKQPASILLTTHHLDEADTLCDRIGIIKKGRLQCIAPQKELKEQYGQAYSLLLMADCDATVPTDARSAEDVMSQVDRERLNTLNGLVISAMGLSATTSQGTPHTLHTPKSVSRRRITYASDKNNDTTVSWKLYVRLSIPTNRFNFDVMDAVVERLKDEGVVEWRLGTVELEEVFVSALL